MALNIKPFYPLEHPEVSYHRIQTELVPDKEDAKADNSRKKQYYVKSKKDDLDKLLASPLAKLNII